MKYGNEPSNSYDGKSFHSKLERNRYEELSFLAKAGDVSELQTQVTFRLDVAGLHICKYIADFVYLDSKGRQVVEDTKGVLTDVYRLKRKLMKACHGIDIVEVYAAKRKIPKKAWPAGRKLPTRRVRQA